MKACIPPEIADRLRTSLEKGEVDANMIASMLPDEKVALKALLEDVVSDGLGIKVSSEEVANISKLAKKIDEAQVKLGGDLGVPTKVQEHIDFFRAKKNMDDYLQSRTPSHKLKVLTGTIGRGMMLASVKSPLLNIGSNIEIGFAEALARRISALSLRGTDNKMALDFVKMANKIYQKTGYDISRMTSINDLGSAGERVLGKIVHSQGKGFIRGTGRVVEDVVFKQLMGAPDVAFASAHFADSVNLNALKFGDKAKEVMADAMRVEPQTAEGLILRNQGILDAQKATWTDTTWASKVSEGIRKILNEVSGDLRAGDYLLPFVKTPANLVATGMDYGGVGIPKAFFKMYKGIRTGELGNKETVRGIARDLVTAGLGITGALLVTSHLKDDDYVGAYDPSRAQIESLRNSNYNAVRIRGKWIALDWFGSLGIPINAIMSARKYGKTPGEKTFQYTKGVLTSAFNIPGVSDIFDSVKTYAYKKNQNLEEMTGETTNYIAEELASRLIASIFPDVSKAVDPLVRSTVGKSLGFIPNTVVNKIPFLSKTLPAKRNIFGEEVKGEPAVSDILFGSRVKTDREDSLVKEINSVAVNVDKGISFTDWDKSSSKQLSQFKDKVGKDRFNQAKIKYGNELKRLLTIETSKQSYKKLSDEEKLKVINSQDSEAMSRIFGLYYFKYQRDKK